MQFIIQPRERWKIVTYPNIMKNKYYVSNYGKVKDSDGKLLKIYSPKDDRPIVYLMKTNGNILPFKVYRLVAYEFVPNDDPLHKITVNHKDFDTKNSFYLNLEWMTYKENNDHAMNNGVGKQFQKGSLHPNSTYSDEMIEYICKCIKNGLSSKQMYSNMINKFNLKTSFNNFSKQVSKIRHGERWTHISKKFDLIS